MPGIPEAWGAGEGGGRGGFPGRAQRWQLPQVDASGNQHLQPARAALSPSGAVAILLVAAALRL